MLSTPPPPRSSSSSSSTIMASVTSIVASLRATTSSPRELAVALHDFVRDEIKFGFTKQHDKASAEYTLQRGVGHCTPKTQLFVVLLKEAGFHDATMLGVPIHGQVLNHLGCNESSPYPKHLHHTFTQVTIEGKLCRVDSYVVDKALYHGAENKLHKEEQQGYGIHIQGTTDWNGKGDAFVQYVPTLHTRDLETKYESNQQLVQSPNYLHKDLMIIKSIPLLGYGVGQWLESQNQHIDKIRNI